MALSSQGCGRKVPAVGSSKGHSKAQSVPLCSRLYPSAPCGSSVLRADSNSSGGLPFGTGLWIMNLAVQVTLGNHKACVAVTSESPKAV